MQALFDLADKLGSININQNIDTLFSEQKYQELLPNMIKERLYEQGIYSTGEQIITYSANTPSVYSATTQDIKREKGQPSDRVTLRDTGAFYKSFNLQPKQTYAVIAYNEVKPEGKVSDNVDLDNVFNLSDGELKHLRVIILPDMIEMIKRQLNA